MTDLCWLGDEAPFCAPRHNKVIGGAQPGAHGSHGRPIASAASLRALLTDFTQTSRARDDRAAALGEGHLPALPLHPDCRPQSVLLSMSGATADLETLRAFLIRGRNADGGWGYSPGNASRLEPTCWALLALGPAVEPTVLREWPTVDGLLLERRGGSPNYAFHGQALIALRALGVEHATGNGTILAAVQRVRGKAIPPSTINRQDNSLQAWSWIDDTFSWVEPTAWCLLALKRWSTAGPALIDRRRVEEAERLLIDRCCANGGWNYGNSNMLGQELKPFVPTTALALLALQDRKTLPEVERSIAFLERNADQERSGTALALAFMALSVFERRVSAVRDALFAQIWTTILMARHTSAAMALFALDEDKGHEAVVV